MSDFIKEEMRENSVRILKEMEVPFSEHNNGYHLILDVDDDIVDFYPSTGRWQFRSTRRYDQGLVRMLKMLGYEVNANDFDITLR